MISAAEMRRLLVDGGFADSTARGFADALAALGPPSSGDRPDAFEHEAAEIGRVCRTGRELLDRLPLRSTRVAAERAAGDAVVRAMAEASRRFFRARRALIYDRLTVHRTQPLRLEELAAKGADLLPGILPNAAELARESERLQMDKDGLELHQGLFFSELLSDPSIGLHLCAAMLRPTPRALALQAEFERTGRVDLGAAYVEVAGEVAYVELRHPKYLNAEDDETLPAHETACDLVLLHPGVKMGVLRGGVIEHPRYQGRRIFSAGLNLTRLYHGKISFLFYLVRDLGFVNKLYRGLLTDPEGLNPDELANGPERTLEKPWVAVVEGFAIGGGCQLLLVMDYVIAESGAYCNLPARKEGIIPGCANLRLPRLVGERAAREAIMFDRAFQVDHADAAGLVNQVCPRERIDEAIRECTANAIGSGMVSASGNRKALRVQAEPLDTFRAYMATYTGEQAFCHLSEQLIENLRKHWRAAERRL
jgi:thioesterase DpgC